MKPTNYSFSPVPHSHFIKYTLILYPKFIAMKNTTVLLSLLFVLFFSSAVLAQNGNDSKPVILDTLVTKKNEITKVTESDFEYRRTMEADGPVYTVSRDKIREIRWGNGSREMVLADEMDVNQEKAILDKRSDIQFHFFSVVTDKLTFTYEHAIKVGTNLEITAGIINNKMGLSVNGSNSGPLTDGGIVGVGVKFLLGQDYYVKGMKYAHPLKGRYIKPEILYAGFIQHGVVSGYYPGPYGSVGQPYITDQKINSVAILFNYGRQFILGNILTVGYSVGIGYSINGMTSSSNTPAPPSSSLFGNTNEAPTYLYTHDHAGPLAFNGNITVGYIFK